MNMIWWFIGFPIGLSIGNFVAALHLASEERPHKQFEICSALWFILTVMIYGVFK